MRGLSAALTATVFSGASSEGAAMRIRPAKGKQDLKTTAKTV
jgi:hypothetical protein